MPCCSRKSACARADGDAGVAPPALGGVTRVRKQAPAQRPASLAGRPRHMQEHRPAAHRGVSSAHLQAGEGRRAERVQRARQGLGQ